MRYISCYCSVTNTTVAVDGKIYFECDKSPIGNFAKELYKKIDIDYPKFYKMDMLAKFAFLGVEIFKKHCPSITHYGDDEIALFFGNKKASADSDLQFFESYQNGGTASPSAFVYTLPSILMGELAIRNLWYGENLFVILPEFNPTVFENNCRTFMSGNSKACLCGWVEVLNDDVEVFLFFVEKKQEGKLNYECTAETIKNIFNKK